LSFVTCHLSLATCHWFGNIWVSWTVTALHGTRFTSPGAVNYKRLVTNGQWQLTKPQLFQICCGATKLLT